MTTTRRLSILISLLVTLPLPCAARQVSALWLTAYGDNGAVEHMKFGNRIGNTFGVDSTQPGEYKELEPPPPSPGFDCIWVLPPGRTGQWGSFRGLLRYDWRFFDGYPSRQDTWAVRFMQNDNPAATISFKWPDPYCLSYESDSLVMIDPSGMMGWAANRLNMCTTDTLAIPAAGELGLTTLWIIRYNVPWHDCDFGPCSSPCSLTDVSERDVPYGSPTLSQNYPNPFNPSTTVVVNVPHRQAISVRIFDLLGREVATLYDGIAEPGRREFRWDATGNAGGIYITRMEGGGTAIRRLVMIR